MSCMSAGLLTTSYTSSQRPSLWDPSLTGRHFGIRSVVNPVNCVCIPAPHFTQPLCRIFLVLPR